MAEITQRQARRLLKTAAEVAIFMKTERRLAPIVEDLKRAILSIRNSDAKSNQKKAS